MTNHVALILLLLMAAAGAADYFANDAQAMLFLARRFLHLIDWVVFWR